MTGWLEDPVAWMAALPVFVVPLLAFLSPFVEHLFPPFWGDLLVLVCFFLAGQGALSPAWIAVAALAGSVSGSIVAFVLGRRFGMAIMERMGLRRLAGQGRRARVLLRRFGEPLLVVNRFIPVMRGLLLYSAGALEFRFGRSVFYSAVGSALWVGLLAVAGLWTADSWEEILAVFKRWSGILALVLGLAAALWIGWGLWRLRRGD